MHWPALGHPGAPRTTGGAQGSGGSLSPFSSPQVPVHCHSQVCSLRPFQPPLGLGSGWRPRWHPRQPSAPGLSGWAPTPTPQWAQAPPGLRVASTEAQSHHGLCAGPPAAPFQLFPNQCPPRSPRPAPSRDFLCTRSLLWASSLGPQRDHRGQHGRPWLRGSGASAAWPLGWTSGHPEPHSAQVGKTGGGGGQHPFPRAPQSRPTSWPFSSHPGRRAPWQSALPSPWQASAPKPSTWPSPPRSAADPEPATPQGPTARAPSQPCPSPSLLPQEFPGVLHVPQAQRRCHASPACPPKPGWARTALHRPTPLLGAPWPPPGSWAHLRWLPRGGWTTMAPWPHSPRGWRQLWPLSQLLPGFQAGPTLPAAAGAQELCPDMSARAGPGVGLRLGWHSRA